MKRRSIPWVALGMAWGLALSTPARAYPMPSTLPEGPLAAMSAEDLALARACLRDALDDGADGIIHMWTNSKTGASGTVVPLRWIDRDGMACRHVEITFQSVVESGRYAWMLCQAPEGWRVVGPS